MPPLDTATRYPRLTEGEAAAWLVIETQAASEPCLSAEEIAHLIRGARRADSAGRAPHHDAWTPTYALNWAAWQGWRMKAAKAVLLVDVSTDAGSSVSKSQVREACLEMANQYARGVLVAVETPTTASSLGGFGLGTPGTTVTGEGELLPDDLDVVSDPPFRDGLPVP